MRRLNIAPACNITEADEAFQFALSIFSEGLESSNYPQIKASFWQDDPLFRPENLLLARSTEGNLVGLIRIVPRVIFRGDQRMTVAGLTSVCVHPHFRGQGYSAEMMWFAIEHCRMRGYDLSVLIARRAADYYYTQFGFWGLSSFNRIAVTTDTITRPHHPIQLAPWQSDCHDVYAAAYLRCYRATFGYFERPISLWSHLPQKLQAFGHPSFKTIMISGRPAGYLIHTELLIHEIAWISDLSFTSLVNAIRNTSENNPATGPLIFEISINHLLLSIITGHDVTASSRECQYGGHMVKILNIEKIASALATRIQHKFHSFGIDSYFNECDGIRIEIKNNNCHVSAKQVGGHGLSHSQTCLLLGAFSFSSPSWDVDTRLPFNIALADQF